MTGHSMCRLVVTPTVAVSGSWLEDDSPDQEARFAEHEELDARKNLMVDAMQG